MWLLKFVTVCKRTKTRNVLHSIKKRQSQNAYEITIDSDSIRNLASGLQNLLNKVQQSSGMNQMGGSREYGPPGYSHGYQDRPRGHTPGRGPPPRGPGFGPPGSPGNPGYGPPGPPGGPGYGPPGFGPPGHGQHFGPPGFGGHPPPPPPPPHEGYPGGYGPPGWPGFGPPGRRHWPSYGPPGHQGPPGPPPDFGRYPPPPFEGGMYQGPYPPNRIPNNHNHQKENNANAGKGNPEYIFGGNEDNKTNIVGYLDGGFPIILLEDNEIRR